MEILLSEVHDPDIQFYIKFDPQLLIFEIVDETGWHVYDVHVLDLEELAIRILRECLKDGTVELEALVDALTA